MTAGLLLAACIGVPVAFTLVIFWQIRPLAGALLIPYLTWGLFAMGLNLSIVRRNPDHRHN